MRSGSFAVEGTGAYVVTAVGAESYAERIAGEARAFRHPRSPLERALNRLLFILVGVMVPLGLVLGYALWHRRRPLTRRFRRAVAAVVTLVPEGLILLTSLTFAVAALRMARRGALAQQLNAIESLASVDVVCLDKTGTLTEATLRVVELVPARRDEDELGARSARYAASASARNATLEAIADGAIPPRPRSRTEEVPFSSRRRWSALRLGGDGLRARRAGALPARRARRPGRARGRRRAGACSRSARPRRSGEDPSSRRPASARSGSSSSPSGSAATRARPSRSSARQGVELKVLSGDAPETVGGDRRRRGHRRASRLRRPRACPTTTASCAGSRSTHSVVGRISPEGKQRVVEALRGAGRYVAMVGDGVNDVPALKAARLAIAQGTGAQMARERRRPRARARRLLGRAGDGRRGPQDPPQPPAGREALRHEVGVRRLPDPLDRADADRLSAPAAPSHARRVAHDRDPRLLPRARAELGPVLPRRASCASSRASRVPAGTAAGLGVLSSYLFALNVLDLPLESARTVATTVLVLVGLYLILVLEASGRMRGAAVSLLCLALLGGYALVLVVPFDAGLLRARGARA